MEVAESKIEKKPVTTIKENWKNEEILPFDIYKVCL